MKRLLSVMLALTLVLGAVEVTFAQDQPKEEGKEKKKRKGKKKKGGEEPKPPAAL